MSVWEGGDSWLREVTVPFSGPSVGYWISLLGSLGNGRFGPNPSREVTGGHGRSREVTGANFCHLAAPQPPIEFLFWDHCKTAVLGQILAGRSREVMGGWEVTGGYRGRNGGKCSKTDQKDPRWASLDRIQGVWPKKNQGPLGPISHTNGTPTSPREFYPKEPSPKMLYSLT